MCIWNISKLILLFSCVSYPFYSNAATTNNRYHTIINGGAVHIKGALVAPACTVATESRSQIVDMGQIRSNFFSEVGSDALPVPFFIKLTDCSRETSQRVIVSFLGQVDKRNPHVLQINSPIEQINTVNAKGVGIALFSSSNELILPNTLLSEAQMLHDGDNRLEFMAKYRATSIEIKPGVARATAWFSLTYL
ncbi:fimbrial protein [Providencia sp. Je.9.19]|uniref:fimbrial protein n=1 Tax=Providencia sp. Je.9.19 TaxID=3142844 RepID=UPI003DA7F238